MPCGPLGKCSPFCKLWKFSCSTPLPHGNLAVTVLTLIQKFLAWQVPGRHVKAFYPAKGKTFILTILWTCLSETYCSAYQKTAVIKVDVCLHFCVVIFPFTKISNAQYREMWTLIFYKAKFTQMEWARCPLLTNSVFLFPFSTFPPFVWVA